MAETRGGHSAMVECMSWIYKRLAKYGLESAEECSRGLVLVAIIQDWAKKNKMCAKDEILLSKEWLDRISWSAKGLGFEEFSNACEVISNTERESFMEMCETILQGRKVEHLSAALSIYDTTLDLTLDNSGEDYFSSERRDSGTHYTPWDVAKLMSKKIVKSNDLKLLDPAVGTGTFLLSFIDLNAKGTRRDLLENSIFAGDKNRLAVMATRLVLWAIGDFSNELENNLVEHVIHTDYLSNDCADIWTNLGINAVIINPPYVTHKVGDVNYKDFDCKSCGNLWTLFVERSIDIISKTETPQMVAIVPATIATSVKCKPVRGKIIDECKSLSMMHIDVVPGYLFKQGKTEKSASTSNNTRAISPRVTIFSLNGKGPLADVESTIFLRWHDSEREKLLIKKPEKVDVKAFTRDVFPMGGKKEIKRFLKLKSHQKTIGEILDKNGDYPLHLVKTSRYYISAARTDLGRPNMMELRFKSHKIRDAVHAILVSNLFFWYWRVVGNGFQMSTTLVHDFPIPEDVEKLCNQVSELGEKLLDISDEVAVEKRNANKIMTNLRFDDRNQYVKLIDKQLLALYGLNDTTSEELARFKSPRLEHKIPGEFMIEERDRKTIFNIVLEYINQSHTDVGMEDLYELITKMDKQSNILSKQQKQKHEQRTGPKEYHWRHDLRNSLAGAKSKGILVNPKPEFWGKPRPKFGLDEIDHDLQWSLMKSQALEMLKERGRGENNRIIIGNCKPIVDPFDDSTFKVDSVKENEIVITKVENGRNYVISKNLVSNRVNHLINCEGRLQRSSFHKWKPLSATIVHLHPLLSWDHKDVVISLQ